MISEAKFYGGGQVRDFTSGNPTQVIKWNNVRVWRFTESSGTTFAFRLPDPQEAPASDGGPIFYLITEGMTNNVSLQNHDEAPIFTLVPDKIYTVLCLDPAAPLWRCLEWNANPGAASSGPSSGSGSSGSSIIIS